MSTNRTFNNVQLDVKFTQASTRANITSEENISLSFGKLNKWYEALVPTGGSSGQILGWNSSGTAKWINHTHPTITVSADTTSTPSQLAHSGTFTAITSVTRDSNGHVTKINTATYTLPASGVPSNNVTGSGTSGYLAKWNGTNTITNGPQLGSSTTTFLRNDGTWATPAGTTYSAGNSLILESSTFNLGKRWTAITQGQKWSRIYWMNSKAYIGSSAILNVRGTRGNVVFNATFLVTTTHAASDYANCMQLSGNNYTPFKIRLVVAQASNYYFEIYDDANSIASGTEQSWECCFIALCSDNNVTTYTAFTDGSTIPSGYTVMNEFTTIRNGSTFNNVKALMPIIGAYKSGTWVESLTSSAFIVPDQAGSFGGWICGPTKNGRIAISTYQNQDDKLRFGYGERGRTDNSYAKTMVWDGPTNTLTADKFVGALQGNADTASYLVDSVSSSYKLRYINSNDNTTWTTSTLAATDSIAVIRGNVTDAWTTGHIVTFNVASVGTPFQLGVHDSAELYFYKRYKTGTNTWAEWTKMNAGKADTWTTARTITIGSTGKSVDGSGNVSWSLSEIGAAPSVSGGYLPLSGGLMTGIIKKNAPSSGAFIKARDNAIVYANINASTSSTFCVFGGAKSKTGFWGVGTVPTNDYLYFSWGSDTKYTNNDNTTMNVYIDSTGAFSGTAAGWTTARTLTIGSTGKNVDGTGNVSWSLAEIGAAPANHNHNYLPISTVSTSTDADTLFTTTQWINWNTTTDVSTTHMPTTNYGILLVKASPGPQVFFPDNGTGIYLRKKANASTAATAWMGITGAAGSTYNLANFLTSHQSVSDKNVTLAWGTQKTIATIGSTDIHVTLPSNPNTNTTYTIATGDSNGQIKVTPSSGSAYNVNVKGLGSAAYTASTAYVPISGKAPNGVGKDCFIAYPSDGVLNGDSYNGTITGAIIITLPFTKTSGECMMQFMVDIYNYVNETSVSYKISGYCYNDERWYQCSATCVGKSGKPHSNLAVRFGCVANGNYQIQIGETNGSWSYPRIVIRDISILYKQTSYDSYKSGWTISVSTTAISNVTQTITDTHVTSLLQHRTLNSTTINNSAGSFAFSGTQDPWPSTDWVGLQIGDAADKWQITGNGANFLWRQNDSGGTDSANWSAWKTFLDSNNYTSYTVTKTGGGASGSWGISITGSAASAATATNSNNVAVTVKNTEETYGIPFFSGISTGNKAMYTNDGLAYVSREGTADNVGYGVLSVGNSIAKGTAGNKRGYVRWYGDSSYIIQVYAENVTATRYIKLPDVGGKMGVLTGTVTSGQIVISDGTDGGIKTSGYTTSSFASSGHSHNSLYGAQSSTAVPVTSLSNGQLKVFYNVNYDLSGNMPATNNANAIIQINRHGGNYDSQLGFSNNGNIYYRSCNNETLDTKGWKTVLDNTNSPAFDSIKQRWVKMGTTKGWRRILTMGASSTSGKTMNDIKIHIRRQYNNGTPESCSFHIVHNYTDTPSIIIDHAIQSTKMITQVRLSKSSDGTKVYVEINYDSTSVNDMTIRYDIIAPNGALGHSYYSNIVVPDNATTIAVVSDSPTAIYTADIPTNIAHADLILKTVNQNDSQYWGMTSPYGEDNIWVRTTSQGIIPYQSGASGSGHCYLGTSGWYFFRAYIDEIYGTSFSGNSSSSDLAKTLYYASISNSASNHATVLASYFNTNKTSIPRNKTLSFYSSAFGNGSQYMGYFLNGYNDNPYGGFFVAHYDRAFYVGINNGTFAQHLLLTEHNLSTYLPGVLALNSGYIYSGDKMNYDPQSKKFTVTKTTTTWDCQAYSKSGYSDNVYVSFRPGQTNSAMMLGLDSNPSQDAGYANIDYAWYIKNDGKLQIYESGTASNVSGSYTAGDEFRVEYANGTINYFWNGTIVKSTKRTQHADKMYFDSCFHAAGNVYDFSYGTATTPTSVSAKAVYSFTSSNLPKDFDYGISSGFVSDSSGFGQYGSVMTMRTYSEGGGSLQLYAPYAPNYGGTHMKARFGNYSVSGGNSWTELKTIAWLSDISSILYDEPSGTATTVSNLSIPAETTHLKIFIYDANTSGSNNVTNVIDIGVADGYYGGIISGGLQAQSFPCVITAVQFHVSTSNSLKSVTLGKSSSWTIGSSPTSGSHTLYIRKIIACT